MVHRDAANRWSLQTIWQGSLPIRWLETSPNGRYLVLVDQDNVAQQFIIAEGKLGDSALQLPGQVEDVAFSPNGSRVLFRTARWIHRASSAASGLHWQDALFAPTVVAGSGMAFGDIDDDSAAPLGNQIYVPVSEDGYVQVRRLNFDGANGVALFGNKDELLAEWQLRLGMAE